MNTSNQKRIRFIGGLFAAVFALAVGMAASMGAFGPGSLDPGFDLDGRVTTDFGLYETAGGIAIQTDGKIVIAGFTGEPIGSNGDFAIARYHADGSLDVSFDGDGRVTTDFLGFADHAYAVIIQPDGKIVAAGRADADATDQTAHFAVARYNSDGGLDTTFGEDGKVTTEFTPGRDIAAALVIQPDGKLVVVGAAYNLQPIGPAAALARYNPDGSLDSGFDEDGKFVTSFSGRLGSASGVVMQSDGKIVISGTGSTQTFGDDLAAARFHSNGLPDTNFGIDGVSITDMSEDDDYGTDIALQSDGKIVVVGYAVFLPSDFAMVRYNADGSLDGAFGNGGKVLTRFAISSSRAYDVVIEPNGKIVSIGHTEAQTGFGHDFALVRHDQNGDLDTSFGIGGRVTTSFGVGINQALAAELQTDGKIVAAGFTSPPLASTDIAIARYLTVPSANNPFDYDADGRSDISVFRPSNGAWYLQRSTAGFFGTSFGIDTDKIVPADYDGDRKTDVAVYRQSTGIWYIANSSNGTVSYHAFGIAEDLPTPADYGGDGKADISVFRPSTGTWYRINSSDGSFTAAQFGADGDRPTIGDFDGDGKADIAVFRPSTGAWYQTYSSNGSLFGEQFGISTDKITPADYDGDGRTDIAIYRPSEGLWYVKNSATTTYLPYVFGLADDIPVPGDFDGDGKADIGVFRPSDGTWYIVNSLNGSYTIYQFGQNGDTPTQSAYNN